MASGKGSTLAETLRPWDEQAHLLRCRIEWAAAGRTNLTDEQIADLVLASFPEIYAPNELKSLTEQVAKVTPLRYRRGDAIVEPTSVTKKRRIDEAWNAIVTSSRTTYHHLDTSSSTRDMDHSVSVGFDGEMNEEEDSGWRVGGGRNSPTFKDLHVSLPHDVMVELKKVVILPLLQLKLFHHFGVEPTARILLHGPPGCGKTSLARAIANEARVPFCEIHAADLVSGVSGAFEENIRELFKRAYAKAPCIVFIDEIDALTSKTKSLNKQLMSCMGERHRLIKPVNDDDDSGSSRNTPSHVLVIGATNKIDALDPALRRWFDREYVIAAPDEKARLHILKALTRNLKVEDGFDLAEISRCTLGYVARNLVELVKEAGNVAVDKVMNGRFLQSCQEERDSYKQPFSDEELEDLSLTMADFMEAGEMIYASSEIEDFSTTPNAKWDDVVGLKLLKLEFERHIIKLIKFPEVFKDLSSHKDDYGLPLLPRTLTRFFLYGPSGSGKTFIVEALANKAGAKLIHVKADKLSKYGAQSWWVVQNLLHYAKTCSPCILFFDELEEVRGDDGAKQWPDFRKLISTLGDVVEDPGGVYIIGATNVIGVGKHLDLIRMEFDKIIHVPLPSPAERGAILKVLAQDKPVDAEVDLMAIGKRVTLLDEGCWHFNGHDLNRLMRGAVKAALNRSGGCSEPWTIKHVDFKTSFDHNSLVNSMTRSESKQYERYYGEYLYREALRENNVRRFVLW